MDPLAFLRERDPFLRSVYQAVAASATVLQRRQDQDRAQLIAKAVGEVLFGKS